MNNILRLISHRSRWISVNYGCKATMLLPSVQKEEYQRDNSVEANRNRGNCSHPEIYYIDCER